MRRRFQGDISGGCRCVRGGVEETHETVATNTYRRRRIKTNETPCAPGRDRPAPRPQRLGLRPAQRAVPPRQLSDARRRVGRRAAGRKRVCQLSGLARPVGGGDGRGEGLGFVRQKGARGAALVGQGEEVVGRKGQERGACQGGGRGNRCGWGGKQSVGRGGDGAQIQHAKHMHGKRPGAQKGAPAHLSRQSTRRAPPAASARGQTAHRRARWASGRWRRR